MSVHMSTLACLHTYLHACTYVHLHAVPNEPEHAAPDSACIELPAKRKNVQQQGDVHKRSTRKKCTWDVPLHVHEITDSYPNWEKRRKLDVQMRKGLWKGIPEADFALKLSSCPLQNNQTKTAT